MDAVQGRRHPVPAVQGAPHDVSEVGFYYAADSVFMVLTTRDGKGTPAAKVVGEFTSEEALEIVGKLASVTRMAMEAQDSMHADAVRQLDE